MCSSPLKKSKLKMDYSILRFLVSFLPLVLYCIATEAPTDYILCAYSKGPISHLSEGAEGTETSEVVHSEQPFIKCYRNYCYTLWQDDGNNQSKIMGQGCWTQSGKPNQCDKTECLSVKRPPRARNNTKFCCCSENMCNSNFTDAYVPSDDIPEIPKKEKISLLIWATLGVIFVIFLALKT